MGLSFVKASSQYIDLGSPAVLQFGTAFTVCCWAYRPAAGADTGLVYHGGGWSDVGYGLHWISGTTLRFEMQQTGGSPKVSSDFTVPYSEWHHLAATWSTADNTMRKYLDGVVDAATSSFAVASLGAPSCDLRFASVTTQGRFMEGYIADIRMYNRVLPAQELASIVAMRGMDSIRNGLVGRWMLDEVAPGIGISGAGSIHDLSGQNNDGTPTNSPTGVETFVAGRSRRAA